MYITNITDDYDNITEYDNSTDTINCNIHIIIPVYYLQYPVVYHFYVWWVW